MREIVHGTRQAYFYDRCRCYECWAAGSAYRRRGLEPGDPRHGTVNGYGNLGCRCAECRAAHATNVAQRRADRLARGLPPNDPRHGSDNGYNNWGCRCWPCTVAHSRDNATTNRRRREREKVEIQAVQRAVRLVL